MNFDEIQKQWQSRQGGFKLSVDADVFLKEVQRSKENFESTIFWRDVREIGIAFVLAPAFVYFAIKFHIWSLYFPPLACIFVGVFMIVDRIIQKKKNPRPNEPLLGCIEISLAQVEHQIWLLKNVFWWYLLPFAIGIAVFWGDVAWKVRSDPGTGLRFIGGCFVALIILYTVIYYLNQLAIHKTLLPRKQELQQLQNSLSDPQAEASQITSQSNPAIWRTIMKSRITKLAAAAVIIIAALLSVAVFDKSIPSAFGIEQVIAACNSIQFLHVKQFRANQTEPVESWIKCDRQGRITNARYYLPEYCSPEDGAKLIAWTPEKAEIWLKRKGSFLILQTSKFEPMMRHFIQETQPKLVLTKLLEQQKAGAIVLDIQKSQDKNKPAVITVSYKDNSKKEIYYIDPATDLITAIEYYHIEKNNSMLDSATEYFDYNVPIDEKMFTIRNEAPKDVLVLDQFDQLIGIPQGSMTSEEAATETVRQFFQALIDKDYGKAALIFSGMPEEKMKQLSSHYNVTGIISIGTPARTPECGPHCFKVPCELEITGADGKKTTWKPFGPFVRCGDDERHPDRWIISGGI